MFRAFLIVLTGQLTALLGLTWRELDATDVVIYTDRADADMAEVCVFRP